jgi:putative transcriptional regulator
MINISSEPTSPYMRYQAIMLDHAAGNLPPGSAYVVAAHLALRPQAGEYLCDFEAAGGALLDELPPATLANPDWAINSNQTMQHGPDKQTNVAHVLSSLDQGKWKRNFAGMLTKPIPGVDAQLLKLEAGRSVPHHGHGGSEITLVLSGSFADGHGVYTRGDLVVHDEETHHQPSAVANQDCICLISQTAPVRLDGPVGWLLSRFAR